MTLYVWINYHIIVTTLGMLLNDSVYMYSRVDVSLNPVHCLSSMVQL